jgi:predicted metalloendopeptidase
MTLFGLVAAANILQSMDKTVDPCEDFYTFTCGNWANEHPTPDTAIEHNWFAERTQHVMRRIRGKHQHFLTAAMPIGTLEPCSLTETRGTRM